jgi:mannose-6-phosphate isomerase-like protein (cupin superfamily)
MQAFEMADLVEKRRQSGDSWIEFLRVPALSMGLYVLPAGGTDPQTPHAEDEVYYVVSGRGVLQVEEEDRPVKAGSVLFVEGKAKHRFHSITEELTLMVFFAPAENPEAAP